MTSHSEFGERTAGSEVTRVFADQVRGKTSTAMGVPVHIRCSGFEG